VAKQIVPTGKKRTFTDRLGSSWSTDSDYATVLECVVWLVIGSAAFTFAGKSQ